MNKDVVDSAKKRMLRLIYRHRKTIKKKQYQRRCKGGLRDFEYLSRYHNIHKGEKCFIVATGPSVRLDDLERMSDICTFSVNGIVEVFERTKWRPTYYVIQDTGAMLKYRAHIDRKDFQEMFTSEDMCRDVDIKDMGFNIYPFDQYYHIETAYDEVNPDAVNKIEYKVSDDITKMIYDGFTIVYIAIQIAVYMGFETIYLYGCDCDATPDKNNRTHFYEKGSNDSKGEINMATVRSMNRMIGGYKYLYSVYGKKGTPKIYNAGRGGKLEVFPRIPIERVFEELASR